MRELRHIPPLKRPEFLVEGHFFDHKYNRNKLREVRFFPIRNRAEAIRKVIELKREPQYKNWSFGYRPIKREGQ